MKMEGAGFHEHLLEGRPGGADHLSLDRVGGSDAILLGGEGAGEPRIGDHQGAGILDDLLYVPHELEVVKPHGAVEVSHEAGRRRRGEFRVAAGSIVQGERSHIEQATCNRIPLIVRLVKRRPREHLDFEADIGCGDLAGDQLHHLVANVALAPGNWCDAFNTVWAPAVEAKLQMAATAEVVDFRRKLLISSSLTCQPPAGLVIRVEPYCVPCQDFCIREKWLLHTRDW